jgi:hypothetical protein
LVAFSLVGVDTNQGKEKRLMKYLNRVFDRLRLTINKIKPSPG